MNHESILAGDIPDRYLLGRLPPEEQVEFEEHFLDCPECVDRLESLEGLREGLRLVAPRQRGAAEARRTGRPVSRAMYLLAAACVALAIVPSALLVRTLGQTRSELASARSTSLEMARQRQALAQALARERSEVASRPGGVERPLAASVFTLSLMRGAAPGNHVDKIPIPDARDWTIFLVDRPDPRTEDYRARLATLEGQPIGGVLTASAASGDTLGIAVPPGLLGEGDYVLVLEGGDAPVRDLARYRIRAAFRK